MNDERFLELTTKFLSHEITEQEKNELSIVLQIEQYKKQFETIIENWNNQKRTEAKFDLNEGIDNLSLKLTERDDSFTWGENVSRKNSFFRNYTLIKAAASIAFLFVLATGVLYTLGVFEHKPAVIAWNEKATRMGEKYIVALFDGTKITLNADSKLKYPARFGEDTREVYLEGEGFFEVTHDDNKPFVVHSGDVSTTDIGTKFNISAFPNEKIIEVSLVEGSVKVSANNSGSQKGDVILEPTQQLVYNKENETNKVRTFDDQKATGWKDNVFVFDNEPLSKVFVELERSFGIKFELTDKSYGNKKIKANFKNASLWTITEVIKKATGLQYRMIKENNETKKVVFFKK